MNSPIFTPGGASEWAVRISEGHITRDGRDLTLSPV